MGTICCASLYTRPTGRSFRPAALDRGIVRRRRPHYFHGIMGNLALANACSHSAVWARRRGWGQATAMLIGWDHGVMEVRGLPPMFCSPLSFLSWRASIRTLQSLYYVPSLRPRPAIAAHHHDLPRVSSCLHTDDVKSLADRAVRW